MRFPSYSISIQNEDNSETKITLRENEDNSRLRRVAMPSGMAAQVRELLASSDKTGLVLQRAPPGSSSQIQKYFVLRTVSCIRQFRPVSCVRAKVRIDI